MTHLGDKYYRLKYFGVRYLLDWIMCSFLSKMGYNARYVMPSEVDYRYVWRRYKKLAKQIKYESTYEEGDTIWLMWWQGENAGKPKLVETCIDSIKKNRGEYDVVVIDKYNHKDYIDIPEFILEKMERGVIGIAAFSDYIRFALLEKYGGWYMDATLYVTCTIEQPKNSFYSIKSAEYSEHISKSKWSAYLWYLPKGHPLAMFVHRVFDEYWVRHNKIVNYFLIDCIVRTLYESSPNFKAEVDSLKCDNPNHFFLQAEGCELQYDKEVWDKMSGITQFFKCNWKKRIDVGNSFAGMVLEHKNVNSNEYNICDITKHS